MRSLALNNFDWYRRRRECALVVAEDDLLEGPRAYADSAGRRVNLTHRDVTAQRRRREKCTRRLKVVEKNGSERLSGHRGGHRPGVHGSFLRASRREPRSGGEVLRQRWIPLLSPHSRQSWAR